MPEVRKYQRRCEDCNKQTSDIWTLEFKNTSNIYLCQDCIKALRAKIDRLAILIKEGENTE